MVSISHAVYLIYHERDSVCMWKEWWGKLSRLSVKAMRPRREHNYAQSRFPADQSSVTSLFAQQTSCVMYRTHALLQMSLFQTLAIVNTSYGIQQAPTAFVARGMVLHKWVGSISVWYWQVIIYCISYALTAVTMNNSILRDATLCCLKEIHLCLEHTAASN